MSTNREIESFLGGLEVTAGHLPALAGQPEEAAIPVQGDFLGQRVGIVRGHWTHSTGQQRPDRIYLLPDGASIDVPPERAVRVLANIARNGQDEWSHMELAGGGQLIGPLIWGWEVARPGVEFVREHAKEEYRQASARKAALIGFACLAATIGGAALGGMALDPVVGVGIGIAGMLVTIFAAMGTDISYREWLAENETRKPQEVADAAVRRVTCDLPRHLEQAFDKAVAAAAAQPRPEVGRDGLDKETRDALNRYRHAVGLVEQRNGLGGGDMALIRHSAGMIDQIAARFSGSANLQADAEMRASFRQLIGRAEADVEQALVRDRLEESQEVRGEMDALMRQIELRQGAGKSTQS